MSSNKNKLITDEQKKLLLKWDFVYEVNMLRDAYNFLKSIWNKKEQYPYLYNMAFETFGLHYRNLLEFFYFNKNDKYARKLDFIREVINSKDKKAKLNYYERLNIGITHLSFKRVNRSKNKLTFDFTTMLNELLTEVRNFIDKIPQKYNSEEIMKLYQDIVKYLECIK